MIAQNIHTVKSIESVLQGGVQWAIAQGDCRTILASMPDASVHMVCCSPPYWGLRDYNLPPLLWGGDPECQHDWGDELVQRTRGSLHGANAQAGNTLSGVSGTELRQGQFCRLCGCWKGSLGLEPDPAMYIEHLVGIFREVRRVLRDDGQLWLNISGSYAGSDCGSHDYRPEGASISKSDAKYRGQKPGLAQGFKPKDWVPIPWMLGMALQADGWWLRSPIIWAKGLSFCETYSGSGMPESVRDRPTMSYEYLLLLTKAKSYFYDQNAVRESLRETTKERIKHSWQGTEIGGLRSEPDATKQMGERWGPTAGRNLRSVWAINPSPFPGAHFATFPPKLVEPCIKAGTSERGCCPECGKGWGRITEVSHYEKQKWGVAKDGDAYAIGPMDRGGHAQRQTGGLATGMIAQKRTLGWRPGCSCYDQAIKEFGQIQADDDPELRRLWEYHLTDRIGIEPCVVLDPFCGASTTGLVALRLGRRYLGIDLSEEYCKMGRKRLIDDCPMFNMPVPTIDKER